MIITVCAGERKRAATMLFKDKLYDASKELREIERDFENCRW